MKIAVLGWGSLIWDKRELSIIGDWQVGGPITQGSSYVVRATLG